MGEFKEATFEWYKDAIEKIINKSDMRIYQNQLDVSQFLYWMQNDLDFSDRKIYDYAMKVSKYTHEWADYMRGGKQRGKYDELYWRLLLFEARNRQVDSGLLFLERNRIPKERFYEPRREVFLKHNITQSLQDIMDDKIDILVVALPPGTGKSTIEVFFLSLVGGWFPNNFNLSSAHSSILTRSLYDGVMEIISDPEYTWHDIFPEAKLQGTNAKETTINLERNGRFKTWTFRSIDGSLTGATRCDKILTADDLVSGIEEALNKSRLDTLWTKVVNDLFSRMLDGCKRILFNTRWSVHDPSGRLENMLAGNPRARFIAVPALDENGESNFQYTFNGFSKEYFLQQKEFMDDISFDCLYQQKPIEREGLLFPVEKLRRFVFDKDQLSDGVNCMVMPDREPDAVWAVCDTKDTGGDFESLPIAYQYGEDYFIVDVVFDDTTDYEVLDRKTADILIRHNPHKIRFESNNAGNRVAYNVQKLIDGICRATIEPKHTQANKETKILVNSDWILKHCIFLHSGLYMAQSDYGKFIANIVGYTTKAKVPHDDGPDALSMLSEYVIKPERKVTRIINSPI